MTEEVTVEPKAAKNKKKSPYIVISHPDEKKKKKKKVVVAFKVGDEAEQQKWVSSFNEIKNKVPVN